MNSNVRLMRPCPCGEPSEPHEVPSHPDNIRLLLAIFGNAETQAAIERWAKR